VRDEENGLVYPCGEIGRLAEAMRRLMLDVELYRRFAMCSREIAKSQDAPAVAKKLNDAVRRVSSAHRLRLDQRVAQIIPLLSRKSDES